jgi:hypothetical protein
LPPTSLSSSGAEPFVRIDRLEQHWEARHASRSRFPPPAVENGGLEGPMGLSGSSPRLDITPILVRWRGTPAKGRIRPDPADGGFRRWVSVRVFFVGLGP